MTKRQVATGHRRVAGEQDHPAISVFVAALNEEASVEWVVRELVEALRTLGWAYELLVIDDGSTDGTGPIAARLAVELVGVGVLRHSVNGGLGAVYRTGFAAARGDWITFFPADGQFPAEIIGRFAPLLDQADMVLGYLPRRGGPVLAKLLSFGERVLYRLLFGRLPRFQGIVMFKRRLLKELPLRSTGRGWTILMELIIRACRGGYAVVSVPIEWRPRAAGESKVTNLRTVWANLQQVVALRGYL